MPRIVRCALVQGRSVLPPEAGLTAIEKAIVDKHPAPPRRGGVAAVLP
jgi:hypothetical protein